MPPPKKPRFFLGFCVSEAKKVQGFSIDAKARFFVFWHSNA